MQSTTVLAKPDALRRGLVGKFITRLEEKGLDLRAITVLQPTIEQVRENYQQNADEPWFAAMVAYVASGPIVPMVWQGPNAVESARQVIGDKDVWKSDSGSLRGLYASDPVRTIFHGSRDPVEALREANIWFPELFGVEKQAHTEADLIGALADLVMLTTGVKDRLIVIKSFAPLVPDSAPHGPRPNLERW